MIQLLQESAPARAEPTAIEAAAHAGMLLARFGAWTVLVICVALAWIGTP